MKLKEALPGLEYVVTYSPELVEITGHLSSAILLAQMIFWTGKGTDKAWFYKSADDLQKETGLTYRQQADARKKLKNLKLLEERHNRRGHKMYFRVRMDVLGARRHTTECQEAHDKTSGASLQNVSSLIQSNNRGISGVIEEEGRDAISSAETASELSSLVFSSNRGNEDLLSCLEPTFRTVAGKIIDIPCFKELSPNRKDTAWRIRSELIKLLPPSEAKGARTFYATDPDLIKREVSNALMNMCDCIQDHRDTIVNPMGYLYSSVRKNSKELLQSVSRSSRHRMNDTAGVAI